MHTTGLQRLVFAAALLSVFWSSAAYALPIDPGGGTPGQQIAMACLEKTVATFSANPPNPTLGAKTTLSWSVQVPASCTKTLPRLLLDGVAVPFAGTKDTWPKSGGTYVLTMPIPNGESQVGQVSVSVTLPNPVDILGSTPDWRGLLVQALNTPNMQIRLADNVDMDLTWYHDINVAPGVSLTGGRTAQNPGARLYTTSVQKNLFQLICSGVNNIPIADNVHFSGFRLQGPHWDPIDGDDNLERAMYIESCLGTDIGNMELSGWSGSTIYITDEIRTEPGRQNAMDANTVHIHDNFIHHNQHIGKYGYGVELGTSAWANIERNVFDFNRHAIAAAGTMGTTYRADHNLILKGGGIHGRWYREYTHQLDVHGDQNCGPSSSAWDCGFAGQQFWFTSNAVQYAYASALHIRGTPRYKAFVQNNVFAHPTVNDAVLYNGGNVDIGTGALANTAGKDTFGQYGVCDIDGDGTDDLFLATGASWWYMSSAKRQWVYLNSYTETLDQVGLGDFDGDRRCDVFAVHGNDWVISSGGTSTWRPFVTGAGVPFDQLRFGDFNADGIKDVFRRAPSGQWTITSPGHYGPTNVQSSTVALSDLRFGDFNGDHVTDVMAVVGGQWAVSWGGRSTWQPLNSSLSDSLSGVLIGDVDGNGAADVMRYVATSATSGVWQVSWDGRTGWQTLTSMVFPGTDALDLPALNMRGYVGHFASTTGADLIVVDPSRFGQIVNRTTHALGPYSIYGY